MTVPLQEGEKCLTCKGEGRVISPWSLTTAVSYDPCPDCAGTGMNDKARLKTLEAKLNILWNTHWR